MSNYERHKNKVCGLTSRKCRYCHLEKELCKEDLIGWKKFKDYGDKYITLLTLLKLEARYRHKFESKHIQQLENAFKYKGKRSLESMILSRIIKRLKHKPDNDGKQTPYIKHAIDISMHTTAVCCRYCVEHWHGIKSDKEYVLNDKDIEYLKDVVVTYITEFILPKGSFRDWMISKEFENGEFYEAGVYSFKKEDGLWIPEKIKETPHKTLTHWFKYITKMKSVYGDKVNIKEKLLEGMENNS